MSEETTKIKVHDLDFDGDSDGLAFIQKLTLYEIETIRKYFVYQKDFYLYDGRDYHYRIFMNDDVYMIEKSK